MTILQSVMLSTSEAPSHWPLLVGEVRTNAISSLLVNEISIHLIVKVQPEQKYNEIDIDFWKKRVYLTPFSSLLYHREILVLMVCITV